MSPDVRAMPGRAAPMTSDYLKVERLDFIGSPPGVVVSSNAPSMFLDTGPSVVTSTSPVLNPWHPMSDSVDLKHMGKLAEEAGELASAASRCIIQGINECEPVTKKPNKEWLEDEIADLLANIQLVTKRFQLNENRIIDRCETKIKHLEAWHKMA
jgi:NTP pyrophosphatase (non-canonical NTP hydrolase)